jgi:hypothetical protein
VDRFKTNPSTGFVPNKEEYVLSDLYANMTVLQIHEEMAFAVMSFCPCLIGTKNLFESLDLSPKAVSKYFNI